MSIHHKLRPSKTTMETVPTEIWLEVFAFACTDDGFTGRALSTVSRAVHLISKPLKYQSICVDGTDQLLKFLAVLSVLPSSARKVKYLFISNLDESRDYGDSEIHGRLHVDPSRGRHEQALFQVLHLVSSSLVALHIHRTKMYRPSLLLETDLPVLSELALYGPFRTVQPTNRAVFPSLRRLHLHHPTYHPPNFLNEVTHAAPQLTHLRVPQRSFSMYELQVALGILWSPPSSHDVKAASLLPSRLEKLVIDLDPVPISLNLWASNTRGEEGLRKLRKISDRDNRVCLTDGRNDWMPLDQAKKEWMSR